MTLSVTIIPVTAFAQNASVARCNRTGEAAVIDPGGDLEEIIAAAEAHAARLTTILVTHGHIDHAGGVAALAERLDLRIEGPHPAEKALIAQLPDQARMFGLPAGRAFTPDRWLQHGDRVRIGEVDLEVSHCPGHTPGHVVYFSAADRLAFVGDVLFAGSVGRTDLPGGHTATLLTSITERLWPLGDDVEFVPGHGPTSTFGEERRSNPFVSDRALRRGSP